MLLSAKQYLERSQACDSENCKQHQQQQRIQNVDRSLVLQEFPHLNARHDKVNAEGMQNIDNNIKSVNEFFELSNSMLEKYLDYHHTINESPWQDIVSTRKLENSVLTEYTCNVCSLKFYILSRVEEHCKLVEPDNHKQAILSIIRKSWFESLAEINQRYESDIHEFASVVGERMTV